MEAARIAVRVECNVQSAADSALAAENDPVASLHAVHADEDGGAYLGHDHRCTQPGAAPRRCGMYPAHTSHVHVQVRYVCRQTLLRPRIFVAM
jgi:hypothetical protein